MGELRDYKEGEVISVKIDKGEIQGLFSSIAPQYDLLNTVLSFGTDHLWRKCGVSFLKESHQVLDLCAGTLALTRELLKINPSVSITATDFSEPMLREGQKKLQRDEHQRVSLECSDFFKFVRPPATFDAAMCAYGFRNLEDNTKALKRIHHLLKPGGRLLILEFFRPDRWYTWIFHYTYAQFLIPLIGWLVSRHQGAYKHLRDSVRGFYTLDQYIQLLRKTGFEIKKVKRLTGGISGLIVGEKI
ncbi:MAG: ubiquinone/menaquinone biosynthesis methyltransferase [Deltaproteobacteria bacterium]|nr:ubiquinone/menaquinone biosynthesis methyltransferase [Deltaproteobacteria bacterium]